MLFCPILLYGFLVISSFLLCSLHPIPFFFSCFSCHHPLSLPPSILISPLFWFLHFFLSFPSFFLSSFPQVLPYWGTVPERRFFAKTGRNECLDYEPHRFMLLSLPILSSFKMKTSFSESSGRLTGMMVMMMRRRRRMMGAGSLCCVFTSFFLFLYFERTGCFWV